jgi:23S rRNA pseudouridine2605 synthase
MSPVPVGHDDKPLRTPKTVYVQAMTEDIKDPASPGLENSNQGERIAKRIARAGLASRREAERLIDAGRVTVNGEIMRSPALDVLPDDVITVDGVPVPKAERTRLWRYHKPAGLLVSRGDPQGRRTIYMDLPPELSHAISVGRLDFTSEGLLLLTNDGELSRKLELPTGGMARRYRARAFGHIDQKGLDRLKDGITVDGIHYGPIEAKLEEARGANAWIALTLTEGKNREIRNVLRAIGLHVNRLIRTSYGPFQLGDMPPGAVAEVPAASLMRDLGIATERPKGWAKAKPKKQRPGKNARFSRKPHGDAPHHEEQRGEGRRGEHQSERPSGGRPEPRHYTPRPTEDRSTESRPTEHRPAEQRPSDTRPPKHRPGDRRPSGNFHGETGREKVGEDGNRVIPERATAERRPDFRKEKRFSEPRKFEGGKPERREERPRAPRPQASRDEGPRRDGHRTAPARHDERPRSDRKEFDRPRTEDRPRAQRRQAERAEAEPRQEGPRRDGHPVRAVRSERRDDTRAAPHPYAARNNAERSDSQRRDGPRLGFKPREDRSPSDRPRSPRPYPARGNPERSYYKRPDAERSESPHREGSRPGFKPREDRSSAERPKSGRPYGDRSASERPQSERPKFERTFERTEAPRKTADRSQAPRRDDNRDNNRGGPKGPPRGPNRGPSSGGPKTGGYRPRGPNADRRR